MNNVQSKQKGDVLTGRHLLWTEIWKIIKHKLENVICYVSYQQIEWIFLMSLGKVVANPVASELI